MNQESKETFSSILDVIQKLTTIVEATVAKVEALSGSSSSVKSEPTEQRIARERVERQKASDTRNIVRQVNTGARPTNAARREEAQSRFKELLSPAEIASKPKAAQSAPPVGGESVRFFAYKDGVIGTMEILVSKNFTAS